MLVAKEQIDLCGARPGLIARAGDHLLHAVLRCSRRCALWPCAQTIFRGIVIGSWGHSDAACEWLSWQIVMAVHVCYYILVHRGTRQGHLVKKQDPYAGSPCCGLQRTGFYYIWQDPLELDLE
jgi:hypothetical protein